MRIIREGNVLPFLDVALKRMMCDGEQQFGHQRGISALGKTDRRTDTCSSTSGVCRVHVTGSHKSGPSLQLGTHEC